MIGTSGLTPLSPKALSHCVNPKLNPSAPKPLNQKQGDGGSALGIGLRVLGLGAFKVQGSGFF